MNGRLAFLLKIFMLSVLKILMRFYLVRKWNEDVERYGLPLVSKEDYLSASVRYFVKYRCFPVVRGKSLNDVIFTQKVLDRDPLRVVCCDKLQMREYVEKKLGCAYLADVYFSGDDIAKSQWDALPNEFVVKVNHDSGGVWIVRDKSGCDYEDLRKGISDTLNVRYGGIEGEWPYRYVLPKVFVEELLGEDVAPADYKFHCVNGEVRWVQYIFSRESGGKEVIVDRSGSLLDMALSPNLQSCSDFQVPETWSDMVNAASVLSAGFEYVRVDMYSIGKRIVVGELTFYPLAGLYPVAVSDAFSRLVSDDCLGDLDV